MLSATLVSYPVLFTRLTQSAKSHSERSCQQTLASAALRYLHAANATEEGVQHIGLGCNSTAVVHQRVKGSPGCGTRHQMLGCSILRDILCTCTITGTRPSGLQRSLSRQSDIPGTAASGTTCATAPAKHMCVRRALLFCAITLHIWLLTGCTAC